MTDPKRAHILMVIDRSGSMMTTREDAEGGIRTFATEQAKTAEENELDVSLSLAQFDHEFQWMTK